MIFPKEEQTKDSFQQRFFQETKKKTWKYQPDVFKLQFISILAIRSQTQFIIVSENW